jgi:DNA-binding CsgD family transcriptional regulator
MVDLRPVVGDDGMAPVRPDGRIRAWREEREAEWHDLMRCYQEAVSAFRRVIELSSRYADARPAPAAERARGVPPVASLRRLPSTGGGQLTARQREIARLIAVGMTNRQIAEELVLTEGTVANHVRHILLRLGVRCRAQVAAWVAAGPRSTSASGRRIGGG